MRAFTIIIAIVLAASLVTGCTKEYMPDNKEQDGLPQETKPTDPTPSVSASVSPSPAPSGTPDSTPTPPTPGVTRPEPPVYDLTDKEFWRRVDGSTATIPMSYAIYELFMEDDEGVYDVVWHSKTHEAYQALLDREADVIFVTEPSAEAQKLFDDVGEDIDIIPIVKDAFVLLVNGNNPIKGLTQSQLRDIYSGKITNWKDIGGDDLEIIPYQRGSTSGSQTLFLSLLMRDTQPMQAPSAYYIGDMGGVIDAVAEFNSGRASIGYSVFYYAYAMYGNDNVRFLEVDGELPTEESIITGRYPLESYYYAVMRKDTPADHPARELVSWMLSDAGQALMSQAGYVPLRELNAPFDNAGFEIKYYGDADYHLRGIGAELDDHGSPINTFGIPKKLDTGVFYLHPYTTSDKVNSILDKFIEDTLSRDDIALLMTENIHDYGIPFGQITLTWKDYLTCVVYFGEGSSFLLYDHVPDTFKAYASICIDTKKGEIVAPEVIVNALLKLRYMEGAETVYEQRGDDLRPTPNHIPSDEHVITALWVNSEQAIVIELMDQGMSYRYGISSNDYGGYAGP